MAVNMSKIHWLFFNLCSLFNIITPRFRQLIAKSNQLDPVSLDQIFSHRFKSIPFKCRTCLAKQFYVEIDLLQSQKLIHLLQELGVP